MADETKATTSKTSAKKEETPELTAADAELHGPVSPYGSRVKGGDDATAEEDLPVVVVTIDGEEVQLPPDLTGSILTQASMLVERPSGQPNRSMTEEEIEEDQKAYAARMG